MSLSVTVTTFNQLYNYNTGPICDNFKIVQSSTTSGYILINNLQNLINLDININTTPPVSSSVYEIDVLTTSGSCTFQNNLTLNFYYDNILKGAATITSGSQNLSVQIPTTSTSSTTNGNDGLIGGRIVTGIVGVATLGLVIGKIIPKIRARGYQPLATREIELSSKGYTPITESVANYILEINIPSKLIRSGDGGYTTLYAYINSNNLFKAPEAKQRIIELLNASYFKKDNYNVVKQWLFNYANQRKLEEEFRKRSLTDTQLKKILTAFYNRDVPDLKIEGKITGQKIVDELLILTENVILSTVQMNSVLGTSI